VASPNNDYVAPPDEDKRYQLTSPTTFHQSDGDHGAAGPALAEGPPDLAIEVLSPSTIEHDQVRKRQVYERHGVPHLW